MMILGNYHAVLRELLLTKNIFHGFSKEEEEQLEFLNRKLMENAKNAFKMQQQNSDK